jgi:hypothetical protein
MSYCTLDEAFQTNISESVLPAMRQQNPEEPSSRGERGRLKSKKQRRSNLPPQEPTVVEPDRPAHRPKQAAELLGGGAHGNDTSTSLSSYLTGSQDPNEDYFPFPNGDNEGDPNFDKQFMLEPNWYEQFQHRMPNPRAETPPFPGASVDGYDTLYKNIPVPKTRDSGRYIIRQGDNIPGKPVNIAASVTQDSELKKRIDELFQKIDNLEISRTESNHSEIILFVMVGIFVLLMLDLLLKQGARAIGSIANAVAIPQSGRIGFAGGGNAYSNPFFF